MIYFVIFAVLTIVVFALAFFSPTATSLLHDSNIKAQALKLICAVAAFVLANLVRFEFIMNLLSDMNPDLRVWVAWLLHFVICVATFGVLLIVFWFVAVLIQIFRDRLEVWNSDEL